MKSVKIMLTGLALIGLGAWCAAADGGQGSFLGGASLILPLLGIVVFIVGLFTKKGQ